MLWRRFAASTMVARGEFTVMGRIPTGL